MTLKDEFLQLLENKTPHEAIPFLKSLTPEDKKELAVHIKKVAKNYRKYFSAPNFTLTDELTKKLILDAKAQKILNCFSFVCLSYEDMRRVSEHISLDEVEFYILPWYQPPWLNRYLLEMVDFEIDYGKMIDFIDKGWFSPTKQFIAQQAVYGLQNGFIHPMSYEHIWYLFSEDTNIYVYDEWIVRFKKFINKGILNREKVLQEALLTSTRNFNKPQTGWFCKLFEFLKPTHEELLNLQEELLLSLTSPHSKPITQALKYIKLIQADTRFDIKGFVSHLSILFTHEVKGIVTATLSIIDKLIKSYPQRKVEFSLAMVDTLSSRDETIQVKVLKLLQKHKMIEDKVVLEAIAIYENELYQSAKELLPHTIESPLLEETEFNMFEPIQDKNKLPHYEKLDDLIFFFSGVFMSEEAIAFEQYLRHFSLLAKAINKHNIDRLESLFKQAFLICYPLNLSETFKGHIAYNMAYYLAKYALHLTKKYPIEAKYIDDIYQKARLAKSKSEFLAQNHSELEYINDKEKIDSFALMHHLLIKKLEMIEQENYLPLLCETTHTPCYLDENTLKSRIKLYEKLHIPIDTIDLQIAQERVMDKKFLIKDTLKWNVETQNYKKKSWEDWSDENSVTIASIKLSHMHENQDPLNIHSYGLIIDRGYIPAIDANRILLFRPLNLHIFLRFIITKALQHANFRDQLIVDNVTRQYNSKTGNFELVDGILITLYSLVLNIHSTTLHLFIALSLMHEAKTTRTLSAELWIKAVSEGTMNHQLLGETLGKLENAEYAPLKRFTDLIIDSMLGISTLHNQALFSLLNAMLPQMNEEPIKGMRKLLELYYEVLHIIDDQVPLNVLTKLEIWGEIKSLNVIVKKIKRA
jgi:hypothetical protein